MKKLVFASAIALSLSFAHAASITWGNDDYNFVKDGAVVTSATAPYSFVLVCLGATEDYTGLTAASIRQDGGWDAGTDGGGWNSFGKAYTLSDAAGDVNNYYYAVMAKDSEGNLLNLQYADGDFKGDVIEAFQVTGWTDSSYDGNFNVGSNGNFEAVPEPFSGSLALLGVGLVALRRKMKKAKKA